MNKANHLDYYVARAQTSRDLARRAASPMVAGIHSKLATSYDEVVADLERKERPEQSAQA